MRLGGLAPSEGLLYSCGRVLVGQGIVAMPSTWCRHRGVSVEGMEGLHATDGAGDHGKRISRHKWHVLRCPP